MIKNKSSEYIQVRGARQHNLQNVDIDIPKNCLVCFSGVSGSGKSSLAFDTIYAEGQRRYVESLSTYARQFLGIMKYWMILIFLSDSTITIRIQSRIMIQEIFLFCRLLF